MKYNELNLKEFVPSFLAIVSDKIIQPRNAVNEFFLKAVELFYKPIQNLAIAVGAPFSLESCKACSNDILRDYYDEFQLPYFVECSLEAKQNFLYRTCTTPVGTAPMVDVAVKYAGNRDTVSGSTLPTEMPHVYTLRVAGDIAGIYTDDFVRRYIAVANVVLPVTEALESVSFEHTVHVPGYVGMQSSSSEFVRCPLELNKTYCVHPNISFMNGNAKYFMYLMEGPTSEWSRARSESFNKFFTINAIDCKNPPAYNWRPSMFSIDQSSMRYLRIQNDYSATCEDIKSITVTESMMKEFYVSADLGIKNFQYQTNAICMVEGGLTGTSGKVYYHSGTIAPRIIALYDIDQLPYPKDIIEKFSVAIVPYGTDKILSITRTASSGDLSIPVSRVKLSFL